MKSRRSFLKKVSAGIAGATTITFPEIAKASTLASIPKPVNSDLKLGVASYTLREFSMEEALDMTLRCGVDRITFKSMHLPLDSDRATIQRAAALCQQKGIELYGAGVVYMKTPDEVDQAFAYAQTAGMKMIIGVPHHELLNHVEEKVKETDIKLAIHNHGPGDKLYSSPEDAYVKVKDRDPRMGLCIDIGHAHRIGRDPAADVTAFFDRVFDIHVKDVTAAKAEGETCIIGRGTIDFHTFLKTVQKLGYQGTLALEYEAEAKDPLPGMAESIGYVKGILSTL
ncbi:sugar phosphate isomerase/epimerase [Ulvibacterium sp.]|uniref:sugar phosphate isomerase/epimerase family protein n=1 Tax=Ulvibacterium sp. TaxID=2665914 RepID=UPI0026163E61|nr:sugar phosphate isomerase/epimerase [Ulvibacterium sp.]